MNLPQQSQRWNDAALSVCFCQPDWLIHSLQSLKPADVSHECCSTGGSLLLDERKTNTWNWGRQGTRDTRHKRRAGPKWESFLDIPQTSHRLNICLTKSGQMYAEAQSVHFWPPAEGNRTVWVQLCVSSWVRPPHEECMNVSSEASTRARSRCHPAMLMTCLQPGSTFSPRGDMAASATCT